MFLKLEKNRKYKVIHAESGEIIASDCRLAGDFLSRLKGLMFRRDMDENDALLIVPCNSVHTFFMRFSIDLVFIDKDGNAVFEKRGLPPGHALMPVRGAWAALELKGGKLENLDINKPMKGTKILFEAA